MSSAPGVTASDLASYPPPRSLTLDQEALRVYQRAYYIGVQLDEENPQRKPDASKPKEPPISFTTLAVALLEGEDDTSQWFARTAGRLGPNRDKPCSTGKKISAETVTATRQMPWPPTGGIQLSCRQATADVVVAGGARERRELGAARRRQRHRRPSPRRFLRHQPATLSSRSTAAMGRGREPVAVGVLRVGQPALHVGAVDRRQPACGAEPDAGRVRAARGQGKIARLAGRTSRREHPGGRAARARLSPRLVRWRSSPSFFALIDRAAADVEIGEAVQPLLTRSRYRWRYVS